MGTISQKQKGWIGKGVLCLILAGWSGSPAIAAPGLVLDQTEPQYRLGQYLEILEDPEGQWTLDDVLLPDQDQRFMLNQSDIPNFGITTSAYWVRFQLTNPSETRQLWFLESAFPHHDQIELYTLYTDGTYSYREAGDQLPFREREVNYHNFVFELELPSQSTQTFYLRFQKEGTMQIPLILWDPVAFMEKVSHEQYIFGIYYGMMIVMIVYNFFLYLSIRDRTYLFYVIFVSFFVLYQMSHNGFAFQYLWPNAPIWHNQAVAFWVCSCTFWGLCFFKSFLDTYQHAPLMERISLILMGFSLAGAALSFVFRYGITIYITVFLSVAAPIVIIVGALVCWHKGVISARYLMLAWSAFLLGVLALIFKTMGLIPYNFFSEYTIQTGSGSAVVLLSFALADRINMLKREKFLIQQQALELQQQLVHSYQRFVPSDFLQILEKKSILDIRLGDQVQKEMTILFADIRSFTTLSERMTPAENFSFINSYLGYMGPVIRRNAGFIDKYLGDGIMALFSQPPDNGIRAAVEMLQTLSFYNQKLESLGYRPIQVGIGINTGVLIIGALGEHDRLEGTVISDAVNLASRLEQLTKRYGTSILVSEYTLASLQNPAQFMYRLIDRVKVKGKEQAVTVYEIIDADPAPIRDLKQQICESFEQAWYLFQQQEFEAAAQLFESCLQILPQDRVAQIYTARCQQLIQLQRSNGSQPHLSRMLPLVPWVEKELN